MAFTENEIRKRIVEIGRLMYDKGWVAANDGNISARVSADRVVATPTGISKGMMREEDLILCDLGGRKVDGARECTTEMPMHVVIYAMRPDVGAVVHAHPPVATGYAVAGRPLNLALLPEVVIYLGSIPLAGYGLPGTSELTDALKPFIPVYDALLMANHGVVTYGADLQRAFFNMETVEHFARISLIAELLGGARPLPREEVTRLLQARSRYGVQTRSGQEAASPRTAEDIASPADRHFVTREELAAVIDELIRVRR
jgi:L-fuculose-phosphate aldolase